MVKSGTILSSSEALPNVLASRLGKDVETVPIFLSQGSDLILTLANNSNQTVSLRMQI